MENSEIRKNRGRTGNYGIIVGDIVSYFHQKDLEVIETPLWDRNSLMIKDSKGKIRKITAEHCELITPIKN